MGSAGLFDYNFIALPDSTARYSDRHNARLSHDALICLYCDMFEKARRKRIYLAAWVAKSGHVKNGASADFHKRITAKSEQVDAASGDVLTEITRLD